jgi:NADPH-dependent 2,4-dienoyl-CoA reductase/sulfur reductase-like enzyme/nitrite reductase/ring-hydroxylating ferredoxin subunit
MGGDATPVSGPDLKLGVPVDALRAGEPFPGQVDGDAVVLVRSGDEVFAVGATCTHYSGPLAEGIVTDETIRCPWHHACFSLRTGAATAAPALNPLPHYRTDIRDGVVYVVARDDEEVRKRPVATRTDATAPIVIIGAGAAGHAAMEMLRREGYDGALVVIDADADAPYDRPNISKDYLAGTAPEEWMPLRPRSYYGELGVQRIVDTVTTVDPKARTVTLADGGSFEFAQLLIATGAAPVRPPIPGSDQAHVHTLRSLADCRAIIAALPSVKQVVIVGASFIGMEAAAALRNRGVDVLIVAPEAVPFGRAFGDELGAMLRATHEQRDVRFALGRTVAHIHNDAVVLDDGRRFDAQLVLLATGVRPLLDLAERAGLAVDRGVVVNEFLETSAPGIFAAGDIASYPLHGRQRARIEHWVVAQRQGQTAARNMLGQRRTFDSVPFFWTQQYDIQLSYVGHSTTWDHTEVDGSIQDRDCVIRYIERGTVAAVATINRDMDSLRAEVALERAHDVDENILHA